MPSIVGCALGYNLKTLFPFLVTLAAYSPGVETHLLVRDPAPDLEAFTRSIRVHLHRHVGPGAVRRFEWYASVCTAERSPCLALDTRDVVFQSTPRLDAPGAVLAFAEHATITISRDWHNIRWVRKCFGAPMARTIGSNPIMNSGAILGRTDGFHALVERFNMLNRTALCRPDTHHDQAYLNVAVHTRGVPGASIAYPNESFVQNMALALLRTPRDAARVPGESDDGDWILDTSGARVPVLHQFDRHPRMRRIVRRLVHRATSIVQENGVYVDPRWR